MGRVIPDRASSTDLERTVAVPQERESDVRPTTLAGCVVSWDVTLRAHDIPAHDVGS